MPLDGFEKSTAELGTAQPWHTKTRSVVGWRGRSASRKPQSSSSTTPRDSDLLYHARSRRRADCSGASAARSARPQSLRVNDVPIVPLEPPLEIVLVAIRLE